MSLIKEKCIEFDEHRKICVAEENGKKYVLNNTSNLKIKKVKVDKCLEQNEGEKRCDYLMSIDVPKRQAIFIELKGSDLIKATFQIIETLEFLKEDFKGYQLDVRIVGSRDVPNMIQTPIYKKLASIIKPSGGEIKRATNNVLTENI